MSYRPWDWESTKFENVFKLLPGDGTHPHPYDVYEIAADAILVGLKEGDGSEYYPPEEGRPQSGWVVFIPDEDK